MVSDHLRVVGGGTSWAGRPTGYDPEGFYVEAMGKDKAAATLYVRVPLHILTELEHLIASGELKTTPIKSKQEFIRDALVHNMHRINGMVDNGRFSQAVDNARRTAQADVMDRMYATWRETPEKLKQSFANAQHDESVGMAEDILGIYEPMVDSLPAPYSEQIEAVLKDVRKWIARKA